MPFGENGLILEGRIINRKILIVMARCNNGFLGAFSGRLGPAVGYLWMGRQCVRSLPTEVHNPRTPRQQAGRAVFGAVSSLAASMSQALVVGLRGVAAAMRMSARNVFISLNRQHISLVEGEPVVDYGALRVAEGELEGVVFQTHAPVGLAAATPSNLEGEQINVTFTSEGGRGADYVYLYAYAPEVGMGLLSVPALRCAGRVSIELPTAFRGHAVHLYGFAWDRDLQASPSVYLGCLTPSGEEGTNGLLDEADGLDVNPVALPVEAAGVVLGDDNALEPQAVGLGDALLDTAHGPHLAAEAYLGSQAGVGGDGDVDVGGEHGGGHGQVDGGVGDAQASGNVEEDVLGAELETAALLEDGQQQVEAPQVEARGVALGCAVDGAADEALHLDEDGAHAFEGSTDGGAAEGLVALREKHLRGVVDLAQAVGEHLEDANLGGGAEAVFEGP